MTDTRYYARLPSSCARELFAYLEHLRFWRIEEPSEWVARSQRKMADELGVTPRTVRRWEQLLAELGIIQVQHGHKWNRRTVRLRPLRELPEAAPQARSRRLREWGHACPHSRDTRVPSVASGVTHARASQPNRALEQSPHTPTMRKLSGAGLGHERARGSGLGPATERAVGELVVNLGVWNKRQQELRQVAQGLQRALGERGAVEALAWARSVVRKGGTTSSEGARVLGLLQSRLSKLEERTAPRAGALQHA